MEIMDMAIADSLLKALFGFIGDLRKRRGEKQKEKDLALSALISATSETKIYIRHAQRTGKTNKREEEKLARLWSAASIPIRHFNKDLAGRCLEKADYWLNPDNYKATDIAKFRIGIEQVYKEAKELLLDK